MTPDKNNGYQSYLLRLWTVEENGRIFIEALRRIKPGEELSYDYHLELDAKERRKSKQLYPCHCGSRNCRGTLAAPPAK